MDTLTVAAVLCFCVIIPCMYLGLQLVVYWPYLDPSITKFPLIVNIVSVVDVLMDRSNSVHRKTSIVENLRFEWKIAIRGKTFGVAFL